jgi:hypothetical protein
VWRYCQSTLRFTILPRRTFREGDLRHRDLWPGRRGAQRIDTRDPRAAEASRDETLVSHACSTRHAGETAYARREHVQQNVTFFDNPKHDLQARRWRFVYCAIKHIACESRLAVVAAESHRASGGIFATLQSTLVVKVSDDDDQEDDVDDGERLHYDDASRYARYTIV